MNNNSFLGAALMLAAAAVFALSDALIKYLSIHFDIEQMVFFRVLFGITIITTIALIRNPKQSFIPNNWGLFWIRNILGLGLVLGFYALKYLPLLEFVTIFYAAPLVVALFSPWMLKETVTTRQWLYILIGFGGILIALRPDFETWGIGHAMAVIDMFCYAGMMLLARKHSGGESTAVTNLSIYPLVLIISAVAMSSDWQPLGAFNIFQLFVLACGNTLGMYLVFQSLKYGNAAITAPLEYTNFVWAGIVGALVFDEYPDAIMLVGVVFIALSGTLLAKQHRS